MSSRKTVQGKCISQTVFHEGREPFVFPKVRFQTPIDWHRKQLAFQYVFKVADTAPFSGSEVHASEISTNADTELPRELVFQSRSGRIAPRFEAPATFSCI